MQRSNRMKRCILAHDLGTSGNKATLFAEEGDLVASKTASYSTSYADGNRAEQNPDDWWKAIVDTTRALLAEVKDAEVAAVALSGQMMGCLCIDRDGKPLRPHILYCDQRSVEQEKQIAERIDPLEFYAITGHRISASYSIEKLMWIRQQEPEVFARTAAMLNAKDYINFRLTGVIATDPSDASGTNAYDLNRWAWSEKILEAVELNPSLFPQVRQSIDVIGGITSAVARETGLQAGTPVVCGGGDGSCAGVGVGCVAPGSAYNYLGSSSWIALTVDKPIVDPQRRTMNWAHVVPGLLHPSGTMQTAGAAHSWMAREMCRDKQRQAGEMRENGKNVYQLIDEAIALSPVGANKLLFLPYLLGERTPRWNVDAKGAFIGLTLSHRHEDMLRAVVEGISMNLGYIVNIFRQHVPIHAITVIGGGALSPVWQQIMADTYNAEIHIPNYLEEATSMGAAILGGIGAGIFPNFDVIDRFIKTNKVVQPIPENVAKYKALTPLFDEAYFALCEVYKSLSELRI